MRILPLHCSVVQSWDSRSGNAKHIMLMFTVKCITIILKFIKAFKFKYRYSLTVKWI